jgi:DNA-directed RNA polymerase specialized sigma24 family protein
MGMGMGMGIVAGAANKTTNMDQGVRGWILKTARENLWRVSGHIEIDDLVQDGFMFWHRIVTRYPNVTETKHRMSLFKTAFTNHIHDLSKRKTRLDVVPEADIDVPIEHMREGEDPSQDPDLSFIIKQLPPAIMRVLTRMMERENPYRLRLDRTRETTNERLCRIAGLDPSHRDIQTAVLQYLRGTRLHPQYD